LERSPASASSFEIAARGNLNFLLISDHIQAAIDMPYCRQILLDTASSPARNRPATSQIFLYFGSLTLLIYLATSRGYLVDIATSYILKNRLHATASQVSMFRLLTGIPPTSRLSLAWRATFGARSACGIAAIFSASRL